MKVKLEYVWLDGYKPEPNLRSKVKIVEYELIKNLSVQDFPEWNFDGSSTEQANTGNSDCLLKTAGPGDITIDLVKSNF
jgi:glutamine synthetase